MAGLLSGMQHGACRMEHAAWGVQSGQGRTWSGSMSMYGFQKLSAPFLRSHNKCSDIACTHAVLLQLSQLAEVGSDVSPLLQHTRTIPHCCNLRQVVSCHGFVATRMRPLNGIISRQAKLCCAGGT